MRDNYYILLELDPAVKDSNVINVAITKKQQQWSTERNHPSKGTIAQQNLAKLTNIKEVMLDLTLRAQEAKDAARILLEQEAARNKDLITMASFLVKNGEISESHLNNLLKKPKFKNLNKADVLRVLNVKLKKGDTELRDDGIKTLDDTIIKKMRSDLNVVKKKDLFDFLDISPTSSVKLIKERADEVYNNFSKNANKTAEVTASVSLASAVQTYIKDETGKSSYIKSLEVESMAGIYELLDLAGSDKLIDATEYSKIIKELTDKGIRLDRAEYYIQEYCKKKSYTIHKGDKQAYKEQIQCGVCGHLNEPSANNCSSCSSALRIICPKCNNKVNNNNARACDKCGFLIGDMHNATYLIRDANVKFAQANILEAKVLLDKAELYWPGNTDAAKLSKQLEVLYTQITNLNIEINKFIKDRKYSAAKQKIGELKRIDKDNVAIKSFERKVDSQIILAVDLCKRAKQESNNERKLDFYLSALEECSDYSEAIIGSSSFPVPPPVNLQVVTNNKNINLIWNAPSNAKALSYRIVRGDSLPRNSSDGKITDIYSTFYDDFEVEPGIAYYYAVYSIRGERWSDTAISVGPILIIDNVRNIQSLTHDSSVSAKWTQPKNVTKIQVYRSESKSTAGKQINSTQDGFNDVGLTNGKEYFYSIISIFEDKSGKEYKSDPIVFSSTPEAPADPVKELEQSTKNNRIMFSWKLPSKGNVQLLLSKSRLNYPIGTVITMQEVNQLGIILTNVSNISAYTDINFQGNVYITALTVFNNNATVGKELMVSNIEEVANLRSVMSGGDIYLEWDWPKGSNEVEVWYKYDGFPDAHSSDASKLSFTKEQYKLNSGFVIKRPSKNDYYFTVFTKNISEGKLILSTGTKIMVVNTEVLNIQYKIVVKSFFGTKAYIELQSPQKVSLLPMILVAKQGGVAINRNDGMQILSIGNVSFSGTYKIDIPSSEISKNRFAKLFFEEENAKFRLQMPKKEDLELN